MKKSLLFWVIFTLIFSANMVFAGTQYGETITKMENSLFGIDYSNQNDEQRLQRLEETVYGKISSGDINKRISKLSSDLHAEMLGQEIKPKKDTFDEEEDHFTELKEQADPNVNYPIVDELENRAFNKTFTAMNIEKRLDNLEKKVFSKTYNDDLSSRTDRLKTALMPKQKLFLDPEDVIDYSQDKIDLSGLYGGNPNSQQFDNMQSQRTAGNYSGGAAPLDMDVIAPLNQLEKKVLKRTYKNEAVATRLVRLETKLFNTTFTQDDNQTRLDRISSAYQASKTSQKYDDNKFSQKMATAMQIGAFILMILAVVL